MVVKWKPAWYELDQSIVVGDIDLFYLSKDKRCFYNGFMGNDDCEIKAEILGIRHTELGDVKGIIAIGLCYSIYLNDGNEIIVNAEEYPGYVESCKFAVKEVKEWDFDVQIRIVQETDLTSAKRAQLLTPNERKVYWRECIKRYKYLLDLTEAVWDRNRTF
ncbi:MAG: hypothetical protein K2I53_01495 [Lachnospiraceae bacterium]|nr:hypothetical protein [Lachnospiraceae bacterium]